MAIDKEQIILNEIKIKLGAPIINIELDESTMTDIFIKSALIEYYTNCPIEYIHQSSDVGNGTSFPVPNLEDYYTSLEAGSSYFLGVVYIVEVPSSEVTSSLFDNFMPPSYADPISDNELTIMTMEHQATMADYYRSDITYNYDEIDNKIYVSPFNGNVAFHLGYGIDGVDYVKNHHLHIVGKVAALKCLETIKTARGSLNIASDVEINEVILDETIQVLRDEVPLLLSGIKTMPVLYA